MKKLRKKRVIFMIPIVLMAIIGILNPSLFNSVNADIVLSTNDSTVKVAAPNELAVVAEMLGGNVVSSSQVTLDTSGMPQFLSTFGVSSNNIKADPWITNYNTFGYGGSDKTNCGWNGYSGSELKPISNATAIALPTHVDALVNKPDVILQLPVGNDTTTANSNGYYGVDGDGFENANDEMENTQEITYYATNNLPTPDDIKTTIINIANKISSTGKTTRYTNPVSIANNFNTYYDANRAKAQTLTSSLSKKKIIHVTAYNSTNNQYTVIPNSANDIYGTTYINDAGGNNVATGATMTASQIAAALGGNGVITTISPHLYKQLNNDSSLSSIPHYMVPSGVYLWSARSPEGALCSLWLAKILHGNEIVTYNGTKGTVGRFINVYNLTYKFYLTYYHYNITNNAAKSLPSIIYGNDVNKNILNPYTGENM